MWQNMNNKSTEIYEQEYRQKEVRYVWTARIALLLSFVFVGIATLFPAGSVLWNVAIWAGAVFFLIMWGASSSGVPMADTKKSSDIFDTIDTFKRVVKMSEMSKISLLVRIADFSMKKKSITQ
jgi:hypothetical protein